MKFQKTRDVKDPIIATKSSAGYDLHLPNDHERIVLHPKQTFKVMTGLKTEIPVGFAGFLLPRSSSGCGGLQLQNTCGVIDADFRDEMQARIRNWSETEDMVINPGERFVQLVVVPVHNSGVEIVEELSTTERTGGFGSTGK